MAPGAAPPPSTRLSGPRQPGAAAFLRERMRRWPGGGLGGGLFRPPLCLPCRSALRGNWLLGFGGSRQAGRISCLNGKSPSLWGLLGAHVRAPDLSVREAQGEWARLSRSSTAGPESAPGSDPEKSSLERGGGGRSRAESPAARGSGGVQQPHAGRASTLPGHGSHGQALEGQAGGRQS